MSHGRAGSPRSPGWVPGSRAASFPCCTGLTCRACSCPLNGGSSQGPQLCAVTPKHSGSRVNPSSTPDSDTSVETNVDAWATGPGIYGTLGEGLIAVHRPALPGRLFSMQVADTGAHLLRAWACAKRLPGSPRTPESIGFKLITWGQKA